jgi:cell division protein FtsL
MAEGRIKRLLPAVLVFGALASAGLFHTWQRVEAIRLAYRVGEVTAEHRTLLRHNEHLRLEVATLKAPARIERLAREDLGMAPPRPSQVVVIRESGGPLPATQTLTAGVRAEEEPRG